MTSPPSAERRHLFDDPRNVRRLLRTLYAACALVVLLDFVIHRHIQHPWERLPEFYPIYGFVGCVALVMAAKVLRRLVMRPADYYERGELAAKGLGAIREGDDSA